MRLLSVVLCLFFSVSAVAQNRLSGAITWEELPNGQYVFTLEVLRECGQNTIGFTNRESIHANGYGSIDVFLQSTRVLAPACIGVGQLSCGQPASGVFELAVYKSAPVSLQVAPSLFGWNISSQVCCMRTNAVNANIPVFTNLYIHANMYAPGQGSSPRWVYDPDLFYISNNNNSLNTLALPGEYGDSLFYKLAGSRAITGSYVPISVVYKSGYSPTSPIPSSLTNTSNGSVSIDPKTGIISYDIKTAIEGEYYVSVAVEQWRDGVRRNEIVFTRPVRYVQDTSNARPSAYIDTSSVNKLSQVSPLTYKATVLQGDTLSFNIKATDVDINQSTLLPQSITFDAFGNRLDSTWNVQAAPGGASITPVAPQSGFASLLNNNVNFKWIPKWSDVKSSPHYFVFSFNDDKCPYPGVTYLSLEVEVERASQPTDSLGPIDINVDAGQVGVDELLNTNVEVYPNPANDVITLSGFETEGQVQLLDIQGRLLRSYQVSSESLMIKREGLSSGVYFLNISEGSKNEVRKVIFK